MTHDYLETFKLSFPRMSCQRDVVQCCRHVRSSDQQMQLFLSVVVRNPHAFSQLSRQLLGIITSIPPASYSFILILTLDDLVLSGDQEIITSTDDHRMFEMLPEHALDPDLSHKTNTASSRENRGLFIHASILCSYIMLLAHERSCYCLHTLNSSHRSRIVTLDPPYTSSLPPFTT